PHPYVGLGIHDVGVVLRTRKTTLEAAVSQESTWRCYGSGALEHSAPLSTALSGGGHGRAQPELPHVARHVEGDSFLTEDEDAPNLVPQDEKAVGGEVRLVTGLSENMP
ncbi:hypothetical protein J0S82_002267, partial [Galemys pyrenaicus]